MLDLLLTEQCVVTEFTVHLFVLGEDCSAYILIVLSGIFSVLLEIMKSDNFPNKPLSSPVGSLDLGWICWLSASK